MNYAQAKAIITERAPDLIIDPDSGHQHICVRKSLRGAPFSIALPDAHLAPEEERAAQELEMLAGSIDAANKMLA